MSARRLAPRARCCAAQLARWASSVARQCLASACIAALAASGGPAHRLAGHCPAGLALEPDARVAAPTKEQPQCDHNLGPDAAEGRPKSLPNLATMARQYLGRPASSAGVERLFSKAGKLYGDDKKRQADKTLESCFVCLCKYRVSGLAYIASSKVHQRMRSWACGPLARAYRGLRLAPASHTDNWLVS